MNFQSKLKMLIGNGFTVAQSKMLSNPVTWPSKEDVLPGRQACLTALSLHERELRLCFMRVRGHGLHSRHMQSITSHRNALQLAVSIAVQKKKAAIALISHTFSCSKSPKKFASGFECPGLIYCILCLWTVKSAIWRNTLMYHLPSCSWQEDKFFSHIF